ncbi:MAG TPA: GNAT family N-acetyltransferase [Steroidobacteraceae bacterium]|nr:GNAT family N-acetyltransferase [Steroidobacteraceae bacterium]
MGPWHPERWPAPEIGWAIIRPCWGRGYATEGAVGAMDWAVEARGWTGPGQLPAPFQSTRVNFWAQTQAQWSAHRAQWQLRVHP